MSQLKISNDSKKAIHQFISIFEAINIKTKKDLRVFVYDYGISALSYILDMSNTLSANEVELSHPLIFNYETLKRNRSKFNYPPNVVI